MRKTMRARRVLNVSNMAGAALVVLAAPGCKDDPPPPPRVAAPVASAAAPVAVGTKRYAVDQKGLATFLIDAPLEKGKGHWTKFRGQLDVDPTDLKKTKGQIDLDLDDLKTETFSDPSKNETQTEHAHNWLEIGKDVKPDRREENRWARFRITSIEETTAAKVADAPEKDGGRAATVVAKGDMWLHGVTSAKIVKLNVTFTGPADAPSAIHIVTSEPIRMSLKEHDVKPRDVAGAFISGALEVVVGNKKIDDGVQVSIDVSATKAP
jgi:polyisoprenoid-binding protein YceI